jgi:hypothetical protein
MELFCTDKLLNILSKGKRMTFVCPKCKALFENNETCQDRFDRMQKLELENQKYFSVHHMSVPCYMLQHNQYSREGWLEVRKILSKFIFEEWTPEMARQYAKSNSERGRKTWSYTRSLKLIEVDKIMWSFTITNVREQNAEDYCKDIRRWAKHILADTEPIIILLNEKS